MVTKFAQMKERGDKIAALTAYDAAFAKALSAAGVDAILVGDSLGMVVQGRKDTLAVRLRDIIYHLRAVARGAPDAFVIGDMPFATYQTSPPQAFANAAKLMAAGAAMVKVEGGAEMAETVAFLTARGAPVCAHIGLLPQQIRAAGGYKVQGRGDENAKRVMADALALQDAGAALMVLELLPAALAGEISRRLRIPTLGIGSGAACDGQILVLYDALGIGGRPLKFARDFLAGNDSVAAALSDYVRAVKNGEFPTAENSFS